MRGERGFALVMTLLVTALLVAVATEFIHEVYVDTSLRHSFVEGQQASLLAGSGVAGGARVLQTSLAGREYSSLLDPWARPLRIEDEKGTLQVTIEEESGKLNLNYLASPRGNLDPTVQGIVERLLKGLKLPVDLCDPLADWLDEDEEPRPAGAESAYYGTLQPSYRAKGGKLDTVGELGLVKGYEGRTLERLRPFVTVYADLPNAPAAPVNINTAPREVIAALDENMTDTMADRIIDHRKTAPFKGGGDLANVPGLEKIAIGWVGTRIGFRGSVYRIESRARVGETERVAEAVVRIGMGEPTYLYWREY